MFDITNMPLFAGLDERTLGRVRELGTGIRVPAGTSLGRQWRLARECMLICSGTVAVERDGEVIAQTGPGSFFGECSLLSGPGAVRTASASAITDCDVLVFSGSEFHGLVQLVPALSERIERQAIARLHADLELASLQRDLVPQE